MPDRKHTLIRTLEGMIREFPHYYDKDVVNRLLTDRSLPNRDEKLLAALVDMVDGCLNGRDSLLELFDGTYAARSRPASIDAVTALADLGLIRINTDGANDDRAIRYGERIVLTDADNGELADLLPMGTRVVTWTEAGKTFLAESLREWDAWEQEIATKASRNRKATAIFVDWTDRAALVAAIMMIGLFLSWIRIALFNEN